MNPSLSPEDLATLATASYVFSAAFAVGFSAGREGASYEHLESELPLWSPDDCPEARCRVSILRILARSGHTAGAKAMHDEILSSINPS
jgi:recombinational DNA repair protein (RecF pathway)